MQRDQRLRGRTAFATVRRRGRGPGGPLLAVRGVRTDRPVSRIGFAIPKKTGTAVVRNRIRRRLRAALTALPLAGGWDLVITVRPAAAAQHYEGLAAALAGLLARGRLLRTTQQPPPPNPGDRGAS